MTTSSDKSGHRPQLYEVTGEGVTLKNNNLKYCILDIHVCVKFIS